MEAGDLLDLFRLLVDDGGGTSHVVVNELLLADVDERYEEGYGCAGRAEAPEVYDLDEK